MRGPGRVPGTQATEEAAAHPQAWAAFPHTSAHLHLPSSLSPLQGAFLTHLPSLTPCSLQHASILPDLRQNVSPSAPHQCSRPLRSGSSSDWATQGRQLAHPSKVYEVSEKWVSPGFYQRKCPDVVLVRLTKIYVKVKKSKSRHWSWEAEDLQDLHWGAASWGQSRIQPPLHLSTFQHQEVGL